VAPRIAMTEDELDRVAGQTVWMINRARIASAIARMCVGFDVAPARRRRRRARLAGSLADGLGSVRVMCSCTA
jgi:hypothetical protein